MKLSTCPFLGELEAATGNGEKCAAFSSHCNTPDVFEYKVRSCKTARRTGITYDGKNSQQGSRHSHYTLFVTERHYRCVSFWNDAGYTFFLTERLQGQELEAAVNADYIPSVNKTSATQMQTQCFVSITMDNNLKLITMVDFFARLWSIKRKLGYI